VRIGVLLSGCGLYDGSDVHETVFVLEALERAGERPTLLAPDRPLGRTVDHLTGDAVDGETRNVLRESARLARTPVRALESVRPDHLEALIVPGGYGPVVNLTEGFAVPGAGLALSADVAAFVGHFLRERKPVGVVGLGEVVVRLALKEAVRPPDPTPSPEALSIDADRPVIATPGFGGFGRFREVRLGIDRMVQEILRRLGERGTPEQESGGRG